MKIHLFSFVLFLRRRRSWWLGTTSLLRRYWTLQMTTLWRDHLQLILLAWHGIGADRSTNVIHWTVIAFLHSCFVDDSSAAIVAAAHRTRVIRATWDWWRTSGLRNFSIVSCTDARRHCATYLWRRRYRTTLSGTSINLLRLHHFTRIARWRWSWLIPFRGSRNATTHRRRWWNVPSSRWHRRLANRRATTRFSYAIHVHLFVASVLPAIGIFLFHLQQLLVPVLVGWLLSSFFHDVVDFLALTRRMRWICVVRC